MVFMEILVRIDPQYHVVARVAQWFERWRKDLMILPSRV
jgi:hypothetical protein